MLAGYLARVKMTELFTQGGEGLPVGTTVGSAIEAQKKWQAEQVAKAEEERLLKEKLQKEAAEAKAALDKAVTVVLVSLDRVYKDFNVSRYSDKQEFTIGVSNKTADQMAGVSGSLEFVDIFDKVVGSVSFSITEQIAPGATVKWEGTRDYNQFIAEHRAVWNLEPGKFTTRFVPKMIVFADGKKLSAVKH